MRQKRDSEYFFISVSNRENLALCIKHSLAGFTNSINGLWAYLDIDVGDYVSFLYGARVKNLYRVVDKSAYRDAASLPPWKPITFRTSGRTYYFPFRLLLQRIRTLDEPMVRPEFTYVAENLLLRGGYRKTHFQGDTVILYNVSSMGTPWEGGDNWIELRGEVFTPMIVFRKELQDISEKYYFHETILQSLIRRKIRDALLSDIINIFGLKGEPSEYEVLGEKALPEGFVDLFIKKRHPSERNSYIPIEIKTGRASTKDIKQLTRYLEKLGNETCGGILIAKSFPKILRSSSSNVILATYSFRNLDLDQAYTYNELLNMLEISIQKP